jgi:hypothetical protein
MNKRDIINQIESFIEGARTKDWNAVISFIKQLQAENVNLIDDEDTKEFLEYAFHNNIPLPTFHELVHVMSSQMAARALCISCQHIQFFEHLKVLLSTGLDPNVAVEMDTPLVVATGYNAEPMLVRTLLEAGADPHLSAPSGDYPLRSAVLRNDSSEVVLILLEYGADPSFENKLRMVHFPPSERDSNAIAEARYYKRFDKADLMHAVQVMLIICSASCVQRLGKRSLVKMLPMDVTRLLFRMLTISWL